MSLPEHMVPVFVGCELERVEPADQGPLLVDGALIILKKDAHTRQGVLEDFEGIRRVIIGFLSEFLDGAFVVGCNSIDFGL